MEKCSRCGKDLKGFTISGNGINGLKITNLLCKECDPK